MGLRTLWDSLRRSWSTTSGLVIPPPGASGSILAGGARVSADSALRSSAVWACLRLRADLVSTMPVDAYRIVHGIQVEVPKPPVLVNPGGDRCGMQEWLYSTQVDLDRAGNAFGLITARDGNDLPSRIELVNLADVGVVSQGGQITYRIGGETYPDRDVWHERQYTVSGLAMGLSPVAYAAWSIGAYLSAQQFALDWFGNGATPAVELKNTEKIIPPDVAGEVKRRYQASVAPGGVFVSGRDWELKPINAVSNQSSYVEMMQFGVPDIARFFGVPADLIDGVVSGQSVTYANITQRNLQFLIMQLGPTVARREAALSGVLARPRFVKLNRSALLAMDPQTRAATIKTRLDSRVLTPTEARALEDLPPLTDEQLAEFDRLYGTPRTQPTGATS